MSNVKFLLALITVSHLGTLTLTTEYDCHTEHLFKYQVS